MTLKSHARNALVLCVAAMAGSAQASQRAAPHALVLAQQDPGDDAGDAGGMVVRLGRLEEQVRALTGQIEQLQYQNRKLDENLRKMQADTDFRFQDLQHPGAAAPVGRPVAPAKRTEMDDTATPSGAAAAVPPALPPTADPVRPVPARRTGDAFDPNADPGAPGAPRPLGTTTPSQPLAQRAAPRATLADGTRAPLDLMARPPAPAPDPGADDTTDAPAVIAAPPGTPSLPNANAVASLVPGGTREVYDADLGLYKQGQYDGAATGFQAFADKYPRDRLVPEAIYLAGESYAKLGRHREAAEQFLKVSTDYGKSPRAPDALLRLGMSLSALGAKEQACATYQEVARRYPTASADVRTGVDRELKRAHCPGNG